MSDELAVVPRPTIAALANRVTFEEIAALKNLLDPSMTDVELRLFAAYAQRTGLDPIAKQLYSTHMDGRQVIMTAIDGFRVIAERTGKYAGQGDVVYGDNCRCGEARYGNHPEWAEVPVYRIDWERPVTRRAYYHEYVPVPANGNFRDYNRDSTWRKMPHVMIAKCAEAIGLRVAFPNDLGALYISEEMDQAQERQAPRVVSGAQEPDSTPASSGGGAAPAAPSGDSDGPGLPFQGVVYKVDADIRMVKPPDWSRGMPSPVAKLELAFRIGRSRHTAILLDTVARAAAEAHILVDELVALDGERREITWAADKPPKKELHHVGHLWVMRGGVWQECRWPTNQSGALGTSPGPASEPASPSIPSEAGSAEDAALAGDGSLPDDDLSDAALAAGMPALDAPAPEADEDAISAIPTPPAAPGPSEAPVVLDDVSRAMELGVWANEAGRPCDLEAALIEGKYGQAASGEGYWHGWFKPDEPVRFEVLMPKDEAEAQAVGDLEAGERVRVVGTWARAGNRVMVVGTAVVPL